MKHVSNQKGKPSPMYFFYSKEATVTTMCSGWSWINQYILTACHDAIILLHIFVLLWFVVCWVNFL